MKGRLSEAERRDIREAFRFAWDLFAAIGMIVVGSLLVWSALGGGVSQP